MRTHTIIESPIGPLTLVSEAGTLVGVHMETEHRRGPAARFGPRVDSGFEDASRQLDEYFARKRTEFDLELAPEGDEFQHRVWNQLKAIPYGQTRSYGQIATALGDRTLARAVGIANAQNPISVIVPCHRVIGADGSLVGYGGGLDRKDFLLRLENPERATAQRLF